MSSIELIMSHLDERERAVTKKLLAEMKSNEKDVTHISVLRCELKDILDEKKEYAKKDEMKNIINKYSENDLRRAQL